MLEIVSKRFTELKDQGLRYIGSTGNNFVPDELEGQAFGWLTACSNLIHSITRGKGAYAKSAVKIMDHETLGSGVMVIVAREMYGLLETAQTDWEKGLLREIQYIIAADDFDCFLEHAVAYHRGGKLQESAVLVSAVFEDSLKKVSKRSGLDYEGSAETIIGRLEEADVITSVHGRRLRAAAAVRNKALHANWEQFDLKDVGEAIRITKELIERYLQ